MGRASYSTPLPPTTSPQLPPQQGVEASITQQPALDREIGRPGLEGITVNEDIPLASDKGERELAKVDGSLAETTAGSVTLAEGETSACVQVEALPSTSAQGEFDERENGGLSQKKSLFR